MVGRFLLHSTEGTIFHWLRTVDQGQIGTRVKLVRASIEKSPTRLAVVVCHDPAFSDRHSLP